MQTSPLFIEMMNKVFSGCFAGIKLYFQFKFENTNRYFNNWLTEDSDTKEQRIAVKQEDFDDLKNRWDQEESAYTEYTLCVYRACDELLKYNRCIFHGAAFLWEGKAFVFTAPSGTGKSTQLNNWTSLYDSEIQIMNGDKPIFEINGHKIIVHPSPWKGKEGFGNNSLSAPLGGIIILKQGNYNSMIRIKPNQSVPYLLKRILFTAESKELVLQAGNLIDAVVSSVPVWKLINTGDEESAVLAYETIREELNL